MKVGDKITVFLEEKTGRTAKDGVEGVVVYLTKVQDNSKYELVRAGKTQVGMLRVDRIVKDLVGYK